MRNIPDVAMVADQVWVVWNQTEHGPWSGTSIAAPLWAGFTALVNEQAAADCKASAGFINPAIYAIGGGASYSGCFHDITNGNNNTLLFGPGFNAASGYDLCAGWGTPTGGTLMNAINALSV
jgi:subtilase family serine protease